MDIEQQPIANTVSTPATMDTETWRLHDLTACRFMLKVVRIQLRHVAMGRYPENIGAHMAKS